jgi:hypothetical protein
MILQALFFSEPSSQSLNQLVNAVFKNCFILGAIFYIIFSVVVIRQIAIMKKTVKTSFSPVVQLLGYIHLFLALSVLLLFLVWL